VALLQPLVDLRRSVTLENTTATPADREKLFGSPERWRSANGSHARTHPPPLTAVQDVCLFRGPIACLRIYGRDLVRRLSEEGCVVELHSVSAAYDQTAIRRYGIDPFETLFLCRPQHWPWHQHARANCSQ